MKRFLALVSAALILLPFSASASELKIVASFSILGDMVRQVAGPDAQIATIVGPNADAHVYQPNSADAKAVAQADIIFVNGLGFETWSENLIANAGSDAPVIVATDGIKPLEVKGSIDPHAWNSLLNGQKYVANIAEALAEHNPDHAARYRANAEVYSAELATLDESARQQFAELPKNRRTVVTAHDAFGYLAAAYDLKFLSPLGIDTESEPSARQLAQLIRQIRLEKAAALFVENISNPALLEQIAQETGLDIGGRLFSDALSATRGPATSYQDMFRHNLQTLIAALEE